MILLLYGKSRFHLPQITPQLLSLPLIFEQHVSHLLFKRLETIGGYKLEVAPPIQFLLV